VTVTGRPIWMHGTDVTDFDSQDFRGFFCCRLALWIALTTPGNKRSPDSKEGSRVLNHNLKRSQSPCGDEVHGCGPLLNPSVHDLDIAEIAGSDASPQELALAGRALDEVDVRGGEGDCEGQSGQSRPGTQVRDRRRRPNLLELECDQGVGQVVVHRAGGVDRRRGEGVVRQDVEQRLELSLGRRRQAVALGERCHPALRGQVAPARAR